MALTKLPKNAFGTGSVDDSKIEDGTIQNQELAGSLSEDKLATGTIENASLSNSTITINGTSISLGGSSSVGVDVNWQSVITGAGSSSTAVAGNGYFIDTTSNTHTLNLPASASLGDQIAIKDYAGTFASNNLTIGRNGHNIQGVANDSLISTNRASLLLVYVDSTKGWIYAEESNVADLQGPTFITATGGTITTSGDYKIHSFTGDGCFVVSSLANCLPASGPNNVDYLVVAGGGGASAEHAGGGGAGGARIGACTSCTGITVTATTYPVTVGGGGAGSVGPTANPGSNSIFSTITSTGGGRGGSYAVAGDPGGSGGGSAGGDSIVPTSSQGSGNTPPVSPPQGNPGGTGGPGSGPNAGGGGGGANAAGGNWPSNNGGAGLDVTPVFGVAPQPFYQSDQPQAGPSSTGLFAGGGSGTSGPPGSVVPGGPGGGGDGGGGVPTSQPAGSGTANTGGGGGGLRTGSGVSGGSGGKGIVVIRYKFQ